MKLTAFLFVVLAALMFLVPTMRSEQRNEFVMRQAQEEAPQGILDRPNTFEVIYRAASPEENPVADIYWMKKAAKLALEAGIPYFNVLDQDIYEEKNVESENTLSVVVGVIELDNDPMEAEFDAYEIESLILKDDLP